jgi:hypothetical protein
MWSLLESIFSMHKKHEGGQSQCIPLFCVMDVAVIFVDGREVWAAAFSAGDKRFGTFTVWTGMA